MAYKRIYLHPVLIGKPGHKGGNIHFGRAKKDIGTFLKQQTNTYISTMFDYFRIDPNWPGMSDVSKRIRNGANLSAIDKAKTLEAETFSAIVESFSGHDSENRFIPYIEMHEFEALLFSDADILAEKSGINILEIQKINDEYENPEEINDNPTKTPGKRLEALKTGYRKVAMGKTISEAIGIKKIREQCPHFNNWLTKLENIKNETE